MLKKWLSAGILTIAAAFMLTACGNQEAQNTPATPNAEKLQVATSFNAMKEFVEAVGKDKVNVVTIIPDGTEPHDFELTTKDMKSLSSVKVFVYSGLGMEPWADQAIQSANNKDLITVEASKGIKAIMNTDEDEIKEHGQYDPHCWLGLNEAQIEVQNIANALAKADPKNADFYRKNAKEYIVQLKTLHDQYASKFASVKKKHFVTGHAAFAYLCREFGLEQNSVEDVFADGEPSPQNMTELVKYCKQHKVKTIFAEEMVSPKVSQTLAKEVGAQVQTINTLESSEGGKTYINAMQENLDKIFKSLQ